MRISEYSIVPPDEIQSPEAFIYIVKSVSCITRAAILSLVLEVGGVCVCEVEHAMGISQPVASRSLSFLKNAGFITSRQIANRVWYEKAKSLSPLHEAICQTVVDIFRKDPHFKLAVEKLNKLRQNQRSENRK